MKWSLNLRKIAAPDSIEEKIFSFLREAAEAEPSKPVVRVVGGWVRDKMLGKPSKDIDVNVDTIKGVDFGNFIRQFAIQRYGPKQQIVSEVKDTEARPDQIKNLSVAFLRIYGQDVEILPARALEIYQKGSRNPKTIGYRQLERISKLKDGQGIATLLQRRRPDLYNLLDLLPENQKNNPREVLALLDAHRRDLTINCMSYNINTGQFEDKTNHGMDDLRTMTLRTPLEPVKTFTDDPLRVLRVLRFFSRYPNSRIDPSVLEAMKDPDVQFQLTRKIKDPNEAQGIVVERTAEEMRKLMKGKQPAAALHAMYETGLLQKILNLPSSLEPLNMDQKNKWHELNIIDHTLEVLKNVNHLSQEFNLPDDERAMMNFAALFHDIGKLDQRSHKNKPNGRGYSGDPSNPQGVPHEVASAEHFKAFAKALKLSNTESQWIGDLVSSHMQPHQHVEDEGKAISDRSLRRYIGKNPTWNFQYIHAMADAMSKSRYPSSTATAPYRSNMDRLKQLAPTMNNLGQGGKANDLLRGNEIEMLTGLSSKPPKGMKSPTEIVKERIREAQYDNPALTREQAMELVRTMVTSGELDVYRPRTASWLARAMALNKV